ncbi:hypothetical protein M432DRAFT_408392 [Thermoascus aurantiacus ATCC 26904]
MNEESSASDNDGGERPVRQKLKETTITEASKTSADTSGHQSTENSDKDSASGRGRVTSKKRSFDDLDNKDAVTGSKEETGHRRKRSRDSKMEDDATADGDSKAARQSNAASGAVTPPEQPLNAEDASKQILSPKKKRSIDQLDNDANNVAGKPEEGVSGDKAHAEGEPERKRHRDSSQEKDSTKEPDTASKTSLPSAFANTSTVSPFASFGTPKPPASKDEDSKMAHVTSSSAFASSSLAAFAGSEQSPFGAFGSSNKSSVFKQASTTEAEKPASTGFAAAAGPSPFATAGASGFASFGSGFSGFAAAAPKPGGGLTSFASPGGPGILGTSKAKPFGAPDDEEDEGDEEEGAAEDKPAAGEFEKEKEDERFFKQEVETGEEGETTLFSCKAKLFHFTDKEWKERGIGTFKVNVREQEGGKKTARMIMRADGVLRVMLNTPIFKGMMIGDPTGKEPTTKQVNIASIENGRSVPLLLRTQNNDLAKELYHVVRDLQQHL